MRGFVSRLKRPFSSRTHPGAVNCPAPMDVMSCGKLGSTLTLPNQDGVFGLLLLVCRVASVRGRRLQK